MVQALLYYHWAWRHLLVSLGGSRATFPACFRPAEACIILPLWSSSTFTVLDYLMLEPVHRCVVNIILDAD
jgi:hypothetical protein